MTLIAKFLAPFHLGAFETVCRSAYHHCPAAKTHHKITAPNARQIQLTHLSPLKRASPAPLIIWMHGGGWMRGSRTSVQRGILAQLERGYAVVTVGYSKVWQYRWPAPLEDVEAAIDWCIDHADTLNIDPQRIVLAGVSAGGHLALLAASKFAHASGKIAGIAAFSAPTDLTAIADAGPIAGRVIDGIFGPGSDAVHAASPFFQIASNMPPVFLAHGTGDALCHADQSQRYHHRMQQLGRLSQLHIKQGYAHGDIRFDRRDITEKLERFLDKHCC